MLTKPDLFDAYIATDPSISGLIPFTEEKLAQSYAEKRFYLSSSDIGPGVDPQIVQDHLGGLQVFQQLIKNKNPQGLQWKFSHIADDHGNAYVQSASEGLRFAFSKK